MLAVMGFSYRIFEKVLQDDSSADFDRRLAQAMEEASRGRV